MKKKASLLISGITTVAMLAVAVGSFAAWDTLKAEPTGGLNATTGTPTLLTVDKTSDFTGKLIPEKSKQSDDSVLDSIVGADEAIELVAKVKPAVSAKADKVSLKIATPVVTVATSNGTVAADYDVKVYSDYDTSAHTGTLVAYNTAFDYTANTEYTVVLKFADEAPNGTVTNADTLKVKLEFTAEQKTAA